jgi:hypothetical protein
MSAATRGVSTSFYHAVYQFVPLGGVSHCDLHICVAELSRTNKRDTVHTPTNSSTGIGS